MLGNVDHFELGADGLSITALTGWALDPETPDTPVEVLASVNGIPWGVGTASLFRADLIPIGRAGQLAFRIPLRMPLAITAGLLDGEGLRVVASSCPERPPQWLPLSGQYFLEPLRKIRDAESPATGSVAVFTMVYNEPRNLPLWTRYYGARRPLQSDTEVGYPSTGGFETLFQRLAAVTPGIEVDKRVERIDPVARTAWTSDGTAYHWRRLVSTIPLDQLVERVDGFPTELREEVRSLAYMSLDLLLLRTSIALPDAPQRIYFADPSVPPTRWRSTTPPRCNSAAGPATRSWPRSPTRPPNRSSPPPTSPRWTPWRPWSTPACCLRRRWWRRFVTSTSDTPILSTRMSGRRSLSGSGATSQPSTSTPLADSANGNTSTRMNASARAATSASGSDPTSPADGLAGWLDRSEKTDSSLQTHPATGTS